MPLSIDPQSLTVKGTMRNLPQMPPTSMPSPPYLSRAPLALPINQRRWQNWSSITLSDIIDLVAPSTIGPPSALGPHCSLAVAYWSSSRYSIEGSVLIIHLLCCNFIFFLVHYIVTGSPYMGNLVSRHLFFFFRASPCLCIFFRSKQIFNIKKCNTLIFQTQ